MTIVSIAEERLSPRSFTAPVDVVTRHITRYLDAVRLYDVSMVQSPEYGSLRALDWGCGSGYSLPLLENFFGSVEGHDPAVGVVSEGVTIERLYHAIFLIEVIEHVTIPEAGEMLREIRRHLMLDGLLVVSTPIARQPTWNPTNKHHRHEYGLQELMDLFDATQYRVVGSEINSVVMTDGERKGQGVFALEDSA